VALRDDGSVAIRARGRGKWQVQVECGTDRATGKRLQKTVTVTGTKKQAREREARLLLQYGPRTDAGAHANVEQLVEVWLATAARRLQPRTLEYYRAALHLIPTWLNAMAVWKVRPVDIDHAYGELLDAGTTPAQVVKLHRALRAAFGQAVKWEWVARNPCTAATLPEQTPRRIEPPTPEVVRRLIAAASGDLAAWIHLAALTGARRGEVAALRWTDIDLDRGVMRIERQIVAEGGTLVDKPRTKTGVARRLALGPAALEVIRDLRAVRADAALASGDNLPSDAYLFSADSDGGTPLGPVWATQAFIRLCRAEHVTGVRLHDLRHLVATQLIAAGEDVVTVAGRLGHAQVSTTLDVYAAFLPERDRAAALRMEDVLGEVTRPNGNR
jgi:integrase